MNHKFIIGFKEVYKTRGGKICIVMDYADGGDLSQRINKARTTKSYIPEDTVLNWFTQMCLGMKHIHDRKVIHRDIKAQNVFLMADGSIRLGDFGVARVLDYTVAKAQTQVGTPYYIAPEILKGRAYTSKADIWSLGILLYEMCALDVPIKAANLHDLYKRIMGFRSVPALPRTYSSAVRELVTSMLNVDASKRPSITDLLAHPALSKRVDVCLSEEERKQEFDHTVLHGVHVLGKQPAAAGPAVGARPYSARPSQAAPDSSRGKPVPKPVGFAGRGSGEKIGAKQSARRADQNRPPAQTPKFGMGGRKNSEGFLHAHKLLDNSASKKSSKGMDNYRVNKYGKPNPSQTPRNNGAAKKLGAPAPVGFQKQRPSSAAYGMYKAAGYKKPSPLGQLNGRRPF